MSWSWDGHWQRAVLLVPPIGAVAQDVAGDEDEAEEVQEENRFRDFERLVEGAEVSPGFFDLYMKEGRLYLAVPADRLGQEFLMDMRVAQGIGARGLFGGTTLSTFEMDLMALEKHGENVLLVQRPHRFGAATDDRAAAAVDISVGSSVVESADVEAIRPDSALVTECDELVPLRSLRGGPVDPTIPTGVQRAIWQHQPRPKSELHRRGIQLSRKHERKGHVDVSFRAAWAGPVGRGWAIHPGYDSLYAGQTSRAADGAADCR